MKKLVSLLLIIGIIATSIVSFAIVPVTVLINGEKLTVPAGDVPAQIINNSTMVPMRGVFEALGADLDWIPTSKTIIAKKGSKIIAMEVGSNKMSVTDILEGTNKTVDLPVEPVMITAADKAFGARTLVPLRAVSESLDKLVEWDGVNYIVTVTNKK